MSRLADRNSAQIIPTLSRSAGPAVSSIEAECRTRYYVAGPNLFGRTGFARRFDKYKSIRQNEAPAGRLALHLFLGLSKGRLWRSSLKLRMRVVSGKFMGGRPIDRVRSNDGLAARRPSQHGARGQPDGDTIVVSIFIDPAQFPIGEEFEQFPRRPGPRR